MSGSYPKFRNDRGVPEICIGVKEFMCIGESPPQDPPVRLHQYGRGDAGLTHELLDWVCRKRPYIYELINKEKENGTRMP